MRSTNFIILLLIAIGLTTHRQTLAQSNQALTRLRPIGSPSVVDQFRNTGRPANASTASARLVRNETAYWQTGASQSNAEPVRQTVWMQSGFDAPPLGNSGMALPGSAPNAGVSRPGASTPIPNSTPFPEAAAPPQQLPPRPLPQPAPSSQPVSPSDLSSSDYAPIPKPDLSANAFARVDNCSLVTRPSTYTAAMGYNCGGAQVLPTTYTTPVTGPITPGAGFTPGAGSLPAEIASPATLPPVTVLPPVATQPLAYPNSAAPARSLITFGQERYAVQVGQGLWGQPVAYVPGQGLRNWLRYLSP